MSRAQITITSVPSIVNGDVTEELIPVVSVLPGDGPPEVSWDSSVDWARIDQRVAAGQITEPALIARHEAGRRARIALGIDGGMADARQVLHRYDSDHGMSPYCIVCGYGAVTSEHGFASA